MSAATPVSKAPNEDAGKFERHLQNEPVLQESPLDDQNSRKPADQSEAIGTRRDVSQVPLSYAQQRIWFSERLIGANRVYNVPWVLRLQGLLVREALEAAFNELVCRHEALRTTFVEEEGVPLQIIQSSLSLPLTMVDLREYPKEQSESESERIIQNEVRVPFDLEKGPLLRALLLRLGDEDNILLVVLHHIVFDGWSMGILTRELSALYEAFAQNRPSPLPVLPIQYADYAVWQRSSLQGEVLERHLTYWKTQLAGLELLELPVDRPRPAVQSYRGEVQRFTLSADLVEDLKALSKRDGVTLFMVLLAAFQVLLRRYSGQEDIAVGTPIAGRTHPEVKGVIGFFVNTTVLRADLSGDPSFRELLTRVRKAAWGAGIHQDLPFQMLVEELQPQRDLSRHPLIQVMFILQNAPDAGLQLAGLTVDPLPTHTGTAKFDLTFEFSPAPEGLCLTVEYATDLFEAATVTRMFGHFRTLLEGVVAQPDVRLSQLPMLTEAECRQLLEEWNNTAAEFPRDRCVHQLFQEQVERTPDAVAVVCEDRQLSYRELNASANQLAHYLRGLGVGPEVLVGICLERSLEMIVGLLGILKAGGAYVPLDPTYPKERLAFMLEDTQARVVLTQQTLKDQLPQFSGELISLDADWPSIAKCARDNPAGQTSADNLAYVIYTSGSTGTPKGVEICHLSIARLVFGVNYATFDAGQTFMFLAPLTFDASTFELWGALLHGARCIICPAGVPDVNSLGNLIEQHGINTVWLTAALFNAVVDEKVEVLSGVEQLLTGGEALSVWHVRRASEVLTGTRLINGYGPTESTTFACCYPISRVLAEDATSIPIGRPIGNTQVYVVDAYLNPVPIGVPGELYIGGHGLARGYLNRPELTSERFIPNPFRDDPSARLYKTGDRVRYRSDGNLEFIGRFDNQVKVRGHRIEPGEIETTLLQLPSLREALVIAREEANHDKRLVAYVVPQPGEQTTVETLGSYLKQKLPAYMVPSAFVILETLPLTPNGKVDRRALPAPECDRPTLDSNYVVPSTKIEEELAKIWAEVLGTVKVGVHDNFFDLGGHSLLAVRLLARILEKWPYQQLTIAIFLQAPTVAEFAALLQSGKQISTGCVVPFRKTGTRPPFFCVPGAGGNVVHLRGLYAGMSKNQPLYFLQAKGLDGSDPLKTVEEMADFDIAGIRTIQPEGPYYIGGGSFGGLVAFEIARRLREQGAEIGLLALLDTHNFAHRRTLAKPRLLYEYARFYARRIDYHVRNMRDVPWKDRVSYLSARMKAVHHYLADLLSVATGGSRNPIPAGGRPPQLGEEAGILKEVLNRVTEASIDASRNYSPQYYPGEIILFKASERMDEPYHDVALGWGPFARHVEVIEIEGHHNSVGYRAASRIEAMIEHDSCRVKATVSQSKTDT